MKNLVLVPEMATARAAGLKDITRRLRTNVKAGDICFHGEILERRDHLPSSVSENLIAVYRRDEKPVIVPSPSRVMDQYVPWEWKLRVLPSRMCPERCARLFSMVRSVRQERLQDITEEDAKREGVKVPVFICDEKCSCGKGPRPDKRHMAFPVLAPFEGPRDETTIYRIMFSVLWDELHRKAPWSSNPHLSRIELGPNLTRAEAERLAAIKDPFERLGMARLGELAQEADAVAERLAP